MRRYRYGAIGLLSSLLLAGVAAAQTGSATLTWTAPTANTDGSPVQLAGYRVYYGGSPGNYNFSTSITNPGALSHTVNDLTTGTWYFVVTAFGRNGNESAYSNVASKAIGGVTPPPTAPGAVINLMITPVEQAPASALLTFTWTPNSQFELAIQNTGATELQSVRLVLSDQTFDWLRGGSFLPANLNDNADGISSPSATITTPVAPGQTLNMQGDIDSRNSTGITATFTFVGLPAITKALTVTPTGFSGSAP
jgi:hypothetical protein